MQRKTVDRRLFPRIRSRKPLVVKKLLPGALEIPSSTLELGLGGCSFEQTAYIPPGTPLELQIPLPRKTIAARGRVVYALTMKKGGYEIGVEFYAMSMNDLEHLQRYFGPEAKAFP